MLARGQGGWRCWAECECEPAVPVEANEHRHAWHRGQRLMLPSHQYSVDTAANSSQEASIPSIRHWAEAIALGPYSWNIPSTTANPLRPFSRLPVLVYSHIFHPGEPRPSSAQSWLAIPWPRRE
jgi:hypothetical protein